MISATYRKQVEVLVGLQSSVQRAQEELFMALDKDPNVTAGDSELAQLAIKLADSNQSTVEVLVHFREALKEQDMMRASNKGMVQIFQDLFTLLLEGQDAFTWEDVAFMKRWLKVALSRVEALESGEERLEA